MRKILIFTDIHGRRWICGETVKILFGVVEFGKPRFWNYDWLCNRRKHYDQEKSSRPCQ